MKYPVRLLLAITCLIFFMGCSKEDSQTTIPTYTITCTNKFASTSTVFTSNNHRYAERWNFGDGTGTITTPAGGTTHQYFAPGNYNVTLIIGDGHGTSVTQMETIDADYSFTPNGLAMVGSALYFTSHGAYLSDVSLMWAFGDGTTVTEMEPTHVYAAPGTYTVQLHVHNNTSGKDTTMAQPLTIYRDPVYTYQLCQLRQWHGSVTTFRMSDSARTSTTRIIDTAFSLNYNTPLSVSLGSTLSKFDPAQSVGDAIVFSTNTGGTDLLTAYYDSAKDSAGISYSFNSTAIGSSGNRVIVQLHKP